MGIFKDIKNYWFPIQPTARSSQPMARENNAKNLSRYITPVQLARVKQDIQSWREAIQEAESAFYPHRVKIQRLYQDVVLNGHVESAMTRRKNLTLLKDFMICDRAGKENGEWSDFFKDSEWFYNLMNYALDAKFFGYSLIGLGDIVDNGFPNLEIVRRHNISPDRENLTSYVYSLSGQRFNDPTAKDESGTSFYDWSIWVKTPSDIGVSPCGYGLLYKIGLYEIFMRNNLSWNANFLELFGQPIRWAKSSKTEGDEFDALEQALVNMGSSAYIITDPVDEVALLESKSAGRGHESYDNFESRHVKVISKITFGHADAMDSIAGKLGNQGKDDDSVGKAIREVEKVDNRFFTFLMNGQVLPKLRNLGFRIPEGFRFKFKNDKEEQEEKDKKAESNQKVAMVVKTLKDAGLKVDPKWIEEETGMPVEEAPEPEPMIKNPNIPAKVKSKLEELYKIK